MGINILGITCITLGIVSMMAPGFTGFSIAMMLGALVLIAGIMRIIWAFRADNIGRGILKFAIGSLTLLCGFALISRPVLASGVVTIVLAVYFILDGISEISTGVQMGTHFGGGWLFFAGIVSIMLGIIIWKQFPLSGTWALGILVGIKLFLIGLIMVTASSALRSWQQQHEKMSF